MKKIKVHSLTGRITPKLMQQAFQTVKRNRGAAGVDKVSIDMFDANREENLAALMRDLKGRTFQPRPLRRVYIPKGPGSKKLRPLGIPTVTSQCTSYSPRWGYRARTFWILVELPTHSLNSRSLHASIVIHHGDPLLSLRASMTLRSIQ